MKIIVNGKHTQKVTDALNAVQARCTARTLTAAQVDEILETATRKLDIPKAHMAGTSLAYTGAEHFPSAYKYTPESTHLYAIHNGRSWVITTICRERCPNRYEQYSLELSDAAKEAILKKLTRF